MSIAPAKLADSLIQLQQLFTKADKDGNATLSRAEFTQAAKGVNGFSAASETDTANLFTKLDTNGDGALTKTELTSGIELAEKVQKALLMAQELMSGKALLTMLGNNGTPQDAATSLFSDTAEPSSVPGGLNLADILDKDADTTATDPYTAMLQQLLSKYAAAETPENTTTTEA